MKYLTFWHSSRTRAPKKLTLY